MAEETKRTRNTFNKTRFALFVRTYVAYSIKNYLISKYKIDSKLPKSQVNRLYLDKRTVPEISRFSKGLIVNYQQLWQFIVLNRSKRLNRKIKSDEKIKAYLSIESEIITLKTARQDKENIINEDYERETLSPAIERAAGNSLRNIKDDFIFEEQLEKLQKEYHRWYYEIAYKYKLPTPRILPFILRLIT